MGECRESEGKSGRDNRNYKIRKIRAEENGKCKTEWKKIFLPRFVYICLY